MSISSAQAAQLTVNQAYNLPRLKTILRKGKRFYVTVTYGERTWQTRPVRSIAQRVEWNESLDMFAVQSLSRITVSLYAKMTSQKDILVGRQEIACEHRREFDIIFGQVESHSKHPTEPATLSLTITVSANASSSGPVADSQVEMSHTLDHAQEVVDAMKTWESAVGVIKQVMVHVGPIVKLFPHAVTAWELLSHIPMTLLQQFKRDDNIRNLLQAIRDAFEFAKEADVFANLEPASTQITILIEMLNCVSECAKFIISYAEDVQVGTRTLNNAFGHADGKIEQYRANLVRLRENFLGRAVAIIQVAVLEAELDAKIREMPYKGGWRFGDEKRCLEGTREDFLEYIVNWIENPESKRSLVLLGQAGTGKSTIANEVARRFDGKYLGSYFAFRRKEGSKDDAYQLFTTLARDLSDRHHVFKRELGKVVKDNSSLRSSRDYLTLFERLLLEPLKSLRLSDPILIIIDALDESGDAIGQTGLHTFLGKHLFDLPSNFRVFVTSRPEDGIESAFAKASSVDILHIDDAKLASKTEEDIRMYIQKALHSDVFELYGVELVKAAEGLFQWAAVASGFINSRASLGLSMKMRVQRLLGRSRGLSGEGLLDNLYEEILKECFPSNEAQTLFRTIMGQLFAAIEPLSIHSLIALRRYAPIDDPGSSDPVLVLEILGQLGSLLSNVTSSDRMRPIAPLHTSFRDFLTSKTSNVFHVDLTDAHRQLAHSCLGLMLDDLKFNICNLESSYVANSDVLDLDRRISQHIPPALSYACIFWDDHLEYVAFEQDLFTKLRSFFKKKFLFWLEVLSLKSNVGLALPALSSLLKWLQLEGPQPKVKNLLALVKDGSSFVRYFGMAVARSAPHIYVSALPFAPSSSHILNQYFREFPRTLSLERGKLSHWPALEMTIRAHDGLAYSVAWSPDGQRIASTSEDRTISVWDATTGEVVAGPFTGHTNSVTSVAFSPDGQRIASASQDKTIRVWGAITGEVVAGPFTGHTNRVTSVVFSPDGQHIASASYDHTILIWGATTGEIVAGPFTGHTDWVTSVAFSPDGQHIASASYDNTILVWDAITGEVVAGPFTGHTNWVHSVAFTPNGQCIASASEDRTIRVWDAETGVVVAGPYTGHTDRVTSVAFSPDGRRIASASYDRTIRVCDAATGEVVAGPFTGHTDWATSLAFSPDGQRIASASYDHTIRVWDAAAGEVVARRFTGHTHRVTSVAFSPDGRRIASASCDRTVRMWAAATGEVIARPFTGHTDWVSSVAFSPDGNRIASASYDCTIRVWDAATGEVVARPFTGHTNSVTSVSFSPDGQRIASASHDRTIRVWDAMTGEVVIGPFTGHPNWVTSIAFSPNGHRIASASYDCTIRVWDAATGEAIAGSFTGHTHLVSSVAFSPDGRRIASASYDRTIRVWDAATGEVVAGPFTGHTDSVTSVAFSPDGQHIASASGDNTIRMWDAATGEVVAGPYTGHAHWVSCVAFSPDGQHIVSASRSVIRVEKVTTDNIKDIHFTDQSQINTDDGWIYGKDRELLLWIPLLHWPSLHRPGTVWASGNHETRLDLSKFVHGSSWAKVYQNNLSK